MLLTAPQFITRTGAPSSQALMSSIQSAERAERVDQKRRWLHACQLIAPDQTTRAFAQLQVHRAPIGSTRWGGGVTERRQAVVRRILTWIKNRACISANVEIPRSGSHSMRNP